MHGSRLIEEDCLRFIGFKKKWKSISPSYAKFSTIYRLHSKFVSTSKLYLKYRSIYNIAHIHACIRFVLYIAPFIKRLNSPNRQNVASYIYLENDHTHSANQRREFSCSIFHKLSGITSSGGGFEAQGN